MADDFHLRAIEECKATFRSSLAQVNRRAKAKVTIENRLVESFGKHFRADFKRALTSDTSRTERFAEAAWKVTRDALMAKVHAVAGLAASYAREQRVNGITRAHLKKALALVGPDCSIRTKPLKVGRDNRRVDFCGWPLRGA